MKYVLLVFLLITSVLAAQERRINRSRPAYAYEVINSIPEDVTLPGDREIMSSFLSAKGRARSTFEKNALNACPEFLSGDFSLEEFAVHLDKQVKEMNSAIATAYSQMEAALSGSGRSAIRQVATAAGGLDSADTLAVDMAAATPTLAEASFKRICGST